MQRLLQIVHKHLYQFCTLRLTQTTPFTQQDMPQRPDDHDGFDPQPSDTDNDLPPPNSPPAEGLENRGPSRLEKHVVSTLANIISTFADFLTVSVHSILYERRIYSPELFISTRAYNHPVRQARHPTLCKWIQDAVEACSEQMTEVCFLHHGSIYTNMCPCKG